MNDDLISRKTLLDRFKYGDKETETDKAWICTVRRLIKEQPTAFDKEKVIEEMQKAGGRFCISVKCKEDCQNCEHGILMKALIAIVEKGGIE